MHGIARSEKDTDAVALGKLLWDAADQFRPNSGLKSQEYAAPVLGLIFLRVAELARPMMRQRPPLIESNRDLRRMRSAIAEFASGATPRGA